MHHDADKPPNDRDKPEDQFSQQVQHTPVAARVGDTVSRGVFATGVLVQTGQHEFVLDFLLMVVRPHQVVARVVLPFAVVHHFIAALRHNLDAYTQRFGSVPATPQPDHTSPPPPIEEIYSQLKLPDDIVAGVYANAIMITHSPCEFVFDFITNFYPRSTVVSRVFLTIPQIPRLLESLTRSFEQLRRRHEQQHRPKPPGAPGAPGAEPDPRDPDFPRPPGPESLA